MTTSNLTSENVHIKLQFNDEYRRFLIKRNATFSDVLNNIKTILRFDGDLVVKYLDEENEWITFGSDTELETGLLLNGSNLFRLLVSVPSEESKDRGCGQCTDTTSDEKPWRKRCNRGKGRCRGGKRWFRRFQEEKDNETEKEEGEDDCTSEEKPWRKRCKGGKGRKGGCKGGRRFKRWQEENDETEKKEGGDDCTSDEKPWRKRCKGGRRFKRWQEENDETEKNEGEDDCTSDEKPWRKRCKGGKGQWRRNKRFEEENDEKSDSLSAQEGDSLLSLEQIKQEIEKLQTEMKSLIEKKEAARGEFVALKNQMRECRKTGAVDKILELRKSIGEKKTNLWDIMKEVKKIRIRISSLKKLAKTKTA